MCVVLTGHMDINLVFFRTLNQEYNSIGAAIGFSSISTVSLDIVVARPPDIRIVLVSYQVHDVAAEFIERSKEHQSNRSYVIWLLQEEKGISKHHRIANESQQCRHNIFS